MIETMIEAAELARKATVKDRTVVLMLTELGIVIHARSTRCGRLLQQSNELDWVAFASHPPLLSNSVRIVDQALLNAEHEGMSEAEIRRFDDGREDWKEGEWQDHCGKPGCEDCPPL